MKFPVRSLGPLAALFGCALSAVSAAPAKLPDTPVRPVSETYYGISVVDPYEWLEDASSPEVKRWTQAQADYARAYLDSLPSRDAIRERLKNWNDFQSPAYRHVIFRGGKFFLLKLTPPKNQPALIALVSPTDPQNPGDERVILDPNAVDPSGTTAIDFFVPSLDGKRVAVSLSKGGSEVGTLHVYETATGQELSDRIADVNKPTGGGSVAWSPDGAGFFYTRYPAPGERPKEDLDFYQQIYFHKLGTDASTDRYALGKDFPKIAEIFLASSDDGKYVVAAVANGDGGQYAHYVLMPSGNWVQITRFEDKVVGARIGPAGTLYLLSHEGASRGKLLRLSLASGSPRLASARPFIAESEGVIEDFLPAGSRFYTSELLGGPSRLRVFDASGKAIGVAKTLPSSSVSGLVRAANDDGILFESQSYVQPSAWYSLGGTNRTLVPAKTRLASVSRVDFSDIEVRREFARSKDGTRVPLTILYRKGLKRDGTKPALLYGYGGYSISITPRFSQDLHLWLEKGGVYAVANIRGGGEFGEDWHRSGNLTKKQNVFDDFIAAAEHLLSRGYTRREKLSIEGGSNGGLLMGAVLTQRPDLFHAVVSHVGIYDMLHVERDANGAFNVTEFGSTRDRNQFRALFGYSPYHHVTQGTPYPAILLLTGANDGRVNPYHSKKMAARLQAATSSGKPVLLRVTFDGGHGIGRSTTQKINEEADVYAFLFSELGMPYSVKTP